MEPSRPDIIVRGREAAATLERVQVGGKFLFVGEQKFLIRGVTYGPFCPEPDGSEYHTIDAVDRDFAQMAANGINTVRVYTVPPEWLLDVAAAHGLRVMVGLPWQQHVTFLDDPQQVGDIENRIRDGVRACAGHPAILCFTIGNEIPAPIVRWHGRRRVERFLQRLFDIAREADPAALFTYVNFPTTEYLELPFVDFVCFNVYLEQRERLEAYIARLHSIAGEQPLVLAEVGLDSIRNGDVQQAETIRWQIEAVFGAGCAGTFIFAWTDEWYRGGAEIEDWAFGLCTRDRQPKPALAAVREAFASIPFPDDVDWPRISVVVCSYNGARTLRDTCRGLAALDYPDHEVILVDDGSSDETPAIGHEFGFRVISIPNGGLSNARNVGMKAATGEIVAYIDDDAWPDRHWLQYLAATFASGDFSGVGGPNIAPPGDGIVADCVANSPGGPIHVLIDDVQAEHIPGCNMAFRKEALESIDGFDTRFRIAGDDVDLCWRLLGTGRAIGFSPAAMVWHHSRDRVRTYWKQQRNYGRAEAMLERKWPDKYNVAGHVPWGGRLYGKGLIPSLMSFRARVYHGIWGSAPFQSLYEPAPGVLSSLPLMPEWYMINSALFFLTALGLLWPPLLWTAPVLLTALTIPFVQAFLGAARASFTDPPPSKSEELQKRALTMLLHLLQPLARLLGRIGYGLTPWRRRTTCGFRYPRRSTFSIWSEAWYANEQWLLDLKKHLLQYRALVTYGDEFDEWDLGVHAGLFGTVLVRATVEEHGQGRQLARFRVRPVWLRLAGLVGVGFLAIAVGAVTSGGWGIGLALAAASLVLGSRAFYERGAALSAVAHAVDDLRAQRDQQLDELRRGPAPACGPTPVPGAQPAEEAALLGSGTASGAAPGAEPAAVARDPESPGSEQ